MRPARAVAVAAALFFAAPARGALADEIAGGCDIRFRVTSTLHDFSGTAPCLPFRAPITRSADGRATIPAVAVETAVADMDTGIGRRNAQMRDMFEAAKYPRIRVSLAGIDPAAIRRAMRADPEGRAPIGFMLAIRGAERPVRGVAGNLKESRGAASFEVAFPVSLKEFGLKPPSILGIVRLGDSVAVTAAVRVEGLPPD